MSPRKKANESEQAAELEGGTATGTWLRAFVLHSD